MVDITFSTPSLAELITQAEANFNARLPGADARLRNSVLNVLTRVISGQSKLGFSYLDWVARQAIVDTADAENLDNWGRVWGVPRSSAGKATGSVTFSGTNGVLIDVGVQLQRADGVTYTTTASATIASGTATVAVIADEAGLDGNAAVGTGLTLVEPVAGVTSTATVAAGGLVDGTDIEADESYRARILARIQAPPHGGSRTDYEQWALAVNGVTRAWVYPLEMGLGSVTVRFVKDTNTDPTPQNYATYSEDFVNAAWTKAQCTPTIAPDFAPDGVSSATRLTETGSTGQKRLFRTITGFPSATSLTYSLYVKPTAGRYSVSLYVQGSGTGWIVDFNLNTATGSGLLAGAAGTTGSHTITALAGGWYRISVTANFTSAQTSATAHLYFSDSTTGDGNASYVGDGTSYITVFGAQFEARAAASDYVKADADVIIGSNIIPTPADVAEVLAYIDDPSRAPVTADVYVVAPIAVPLDITITGLNPNTAAVKAAVQAELSDLFARDSEPGGTIRVSRIWEAVSIATGENYHSITSPATDQTQTTGKMWVLGTVTFA